MLWAVDGGILQTFAYYRHVPIYGVTSGPTGDPAAVRAAGAIGFLRLVEMSEGSWVRQRRRIHNTIRIRKHCFRRARGAVGRLGLKTERETGSGSVKGET